MGPPKNGPIAPMLDDIIMIFCGSYANLHNFIADINTIHPSIKFTLQHTKSNNHDDNENNCSCDQSDWVPYLDTSLSIRGGRINSDLYRKPSDKYTCSRSLVTLHIVRTTSLTVLLFELFEFALTQVRET